LVSTNDNKTKLGRWLTATALAPIIAMSVGLSVARPFHFSGERWDIASLALSIIAGLCCLWRLPVSTTKRVWFTVVFVPVGIALLMFYSLLFVCAVFGDYL
jgi:hypothetical protein